jgi:hypothetical protein
LQDLLGNVLAIGLAKKLKALVGLIPAAMFGVPVAEGAENRGRFERGFD